MKENQNSYISVKDFSVSGEEFHLVYNKEYDFLETQPKPTEEELPEYYKSEDYISHTNAKRNLFEKTYHLVRQFSLKRKLKLINSFNPETKTLLDIGCGTGGFLKVAKNDNWIIRGIEPNKNARHLANKQTDNVVFNTEKLLQLQPASFNVITLWHVLEHLPKLEQHLLIIKRLLTKNGTLIIAVPNYKSYDAKYYKQFWAAYDAPRHLWHFSKKSISLVFKKHSMKVVNRKPLFFDAYYVSALSEKYKNKNNNFLKAFCIGFISNLKALYTKQYSSIIYIIKNN